MKKTITSVFQSFEAAKQGLVVLNQYPNDHELFTCSIALIDKSDSTEASFLDLRKPIVQKKGIDGLYTNSLIGFLSSFLQSMEGLFVDLSKDIAHNFDNGKEDEVLLKETADILYPGEVAIITEVRASNAIKIYNVFQDLKSKVYRHQKNEVIKWIN